MSINGSYMKELSVIATRASTSVSGVFDVPSMMKASQALSEEIALDKLLLLLMKIAAENAGAERGALVLKRAQQMRIEAEVSAEHGPSVPDSPVPLEQSSVLPVGIIRFVTRTQECVVLSDAAREGAFTQDAYVMRHRPRSVLCMPLVHQGDVKGILYLENNLMEGAFTDGRAELLRVLCAQMAISIENAYLYADLEARVAERTRELQEAQALLLRFEREAIETQMAGGFAHEMRNALTGAKMLLGKVRGEGEEPTSLCVENSRMLCEMYRRLKHVLPAEEGAAMATLLRQVNAREEQIDASVRAADDALRRALSITNLILEYARIGRGRPGNETVDMLALASAIVRESEVDLEAHGIRIEMAIEPGITLTGREHHFYSILKNLILNARDAIVEKDSREDRSIRVFVTEEPSRHVLCVTDSGVGIPVGERSRIFEPFFSTKPETGTGLGLSTVRKLVALYNGSIEVDSEVGRGTSVTISLPTPPGHSSLPPDSLASRARLER